MIFSFLIDLLPKLKSIFMYLSFSVTEIVKIHFFPLVLVGPGTLHVVKTWWLYLFCEVFGPCNCTVSVI